ncbi:hypothetical protein BGZ65_011194, partial [Modicella reniformis]
LKRPLEEAGEGPSSQRYRPQTLKDVIMSAGLAHKAIEDDVSNISKLDSKERVMVLNHLGRQVDKSDIYYSLPETARDLQKAGTDIQSLELLSAPPGTRFPIVNNVDLYVREEYKRLYQHIAINFTDPLEENRIIVTGSPGIGKSAFLVYFVVRLLAESDDGKPPIIIFQEKEVTMCYVFGGTSIVRKGDITVFDDLLNLPETWYLSDSSKAPVLKNSKTIMSASPKTLIDTYQEATKQAPWYYYMTPWKLDELERCRSKVTSFKVVTHEFMERLYAKIGGIPRYVLEAPSIEIGRSKVADIEVEAEANKEVVEAVALTEACRSVNEAIKFVDEPHKLVACIGNGKDTHVQRTDPTQMAQYRPKHYHLRWGSNYIRQEIFECLKDKTWSDLLKKLVGGGDEFSKGPLFELYIHRIFREGGSSFEVKDLENG